MPDHLWKEPPGEMLECTVCGFTRKPHASGKLPRMACGTATSTAKPPPVEGPGRELALLLASLGVTDLDGCGCKAHVKQMNAWGIDGCREHFDEIVGWLRDGEARFKWADKLKASALAAATGLAFKINWIDPFPGIVEEAIRRADKNQQEQAT